MINCHGHKVSLAHTEQVLFPAGLIVVISWLSFWLPQDSMSDRLNLCLTTILTITLFMVTINETVPKVAYFKALDIYLLTCFALVFLVLVGES